MTAALAMSAMAFSASAQDLGNAVVAEPFVEEGGYLASWDTYFRIYWENDDYEAYELTLAENPQVTVTLNNQDYKVTVSPGSDNTGGGFPDFPDFGLLAEDEDEDEPAVTYIYFDIYDALSAAAEEMGEYSYYGPISIQIPAGLVSSESLSNPDQTLEYKMAKTVYNISQSPAENYDDIFTPQELSNVTLTFDGAVTVVGGAIDVDGMEFTGTAKGNDLVFDFSTLPNGNYTITIPSGYVTVGNEYVINETLWLGYNIFEGLHRAEVLTEIGQYVAAGYVPDILLTWDFATVTSQDPFEATLHLYNSEGGELDVPVYALTLATIENVDGEHTPDYNTRATQTGNALLIDIQGYIPTTYTGQIELIIPEGIVKDASGQANPAQTIGFSIYPYSDATAEFEVEDNMINVSWDGMGVSTPSILFFVVNAEGERTELQNYELNYSTWEYEGQVSINDDYDAFIVDLADLNLANGDYTLVIPGESVYLYAEDNSGFLNHEQYFKFNVNKGEITAIEDETSAVNTIGAETLNGPVYNIHGMKVANDANNLPAGLYIVNGKKILVK